MFLPLKDMCFTNKINKISNQINSTRNLCNYLPSLATKRLDIASGTLVPAAKNVRPITVSGMFNVKPEIQKTTKSHTMLSFYNG